MNILWKGPLTENDRAQQIAIVEQFVSDGVNGIVSVAPLDDTGALRRPVQEAGAKKIPVVIIDSALKGDVGKDFESFVGTKTTPSAGRWPANSSSSCCSAAKARCR